MTSAVRVLVGGPVALAVLSFVLLALGVPWGAVLVIAILGLLATLAIADGMDDGIEGRWDDPDKGYGGWAG